MVTKRMMEDTKYTQKPEGAVGRLTSWFLDLGHLRRSPFLYVSLMQDTELQQFLKPQR